MPPKRATEHKLETPEVPVAKPADRSVLSVGGGGVPDSEAELERLSVQSSSRPRDTFDINVARRNPKPVALSRKDLKKIPFSSNGDSEDDESRVVGKFKGALKIYKLPLPPDLDDDSLMGMDPQFGLFQNIPSNDPLHVLVRVYVIKVCLQSQYSLS